MTDQTNADLYTSILTKINGDYTVNLAVPITNLDMTIAFPIIPPPLPPANPYRITTVLLELKNTAKNYSNFMSLAGTNGSVIADPMDPGSPLHSLFEIYARTIGAGDLANLLGATNNTDIDALLTNPALINDPTYAGLKESFKNLFNQFCKSFNWGIIVDSGVTSQTYLGDTYSAQPGLNGLNFALAFARFCSTTSVVYNNSKDLLTSTTPHPWNVYDILGPASGPDYAHTANYIQSYQDIYEAFNGDIDNDPVQRSLFEQRFAAFYQSEIDKKGYFQTGHDLADWYNYSQSLYFNPLYSPNAITSDPKGTMILNEVLLLLIKMIGTVQNVAAAQAGQLKFLSSWQSSYTEKLNKIHTFSQGDSSVLGTFPQERSKWNQASAQQVRVQLNNVNQSYITKLQANQQTISDQAKALQTNVNQSNDAANQQGSVADSLLQTFSTIISAIFR